MNKKYDIKDIVKLLEKCKEKHLTSDNDLIAYLNSKGCMIGIDQFNKLLKKARQITESEKGSSLDKIKADELENTVRLLYLRNTIKNSFGSFAKKVMFDSLADESLDSKSRFNIALKVYDRFNKDDEIQEQEINEDQGLKGLLTQGLFQIVIDDKDKDINI